MTYRHTSQLMNVTNQCVNKRNTDPPPIRWPSTDTGKDPSSSISLLVYPLHQHSARSKQLTSQYLDQLFNNNIINNRKSTKHVNQSAKCAILSTRQPCTKQPRQAKRSSNHWATQLGSQPACSWTTEVTIKTYLAILNAMEANAASPRSPRPTNSIAEIMARIRVAIMMMMVIMTTMTKEIMIMNKLNYRRKNERCISCQVSQQVWRKERRTIGFKRTSCILAYVFL